MATQVTVITGEGSTSYSVSTGARGPTGATGPEATITNSIVNTAIATNPSATRTAAGLVIGTDVAAQGDTRIEPQVKSSSFTASNGETYHVVASATVTDPSPVEGKGFSVLVRNGTTTVGGTAYGTAGTVIIRTFHSGTWVNHVYRESAYFGTAATTASTDYATAAQGTDERVPTAAGLTSKFSTADAAIVDADRVAVFDSTASFAPKHVLWSLIVSTLTTAFNALYVGLTGNQTVAGDKTLSGVISMTSTTRPTSGGTGTPAATSLITLADSENAKRAWITFHCTNFTGATNVKSGGTSESATLGFSSGQSSATNGNYNGYRYGTFMAINPGGLNTTANFDRRTIFRILTNSPNTASVTGEVRYLWPVSTSYTTGRLTSKGIGFVFIGNKLYGHTHDGTTARITTEFVDFGANATLADCVADSNGSGTVSFYVNGTLLGSLTGPTGTQTNARGVQANVECVDSVSLFFSLLSFSLEVKI